MKAHSWHTMMVCGLLALGGCADWQASRDAAGAIDTNASIYAASARATTLPVTAKADVEAMAGVLECYRSWATVNLWAHWTDANKPVLCTLALYDVITAYAIATNQFVARWDRLAEAKRLEYFTLAATWIVDVKRWKDGLPRSKP